MNKYIAEFIGTMILVFFSTGTAVVTGGFTGGLGLGYLGVVAIALAFGLTIVAGARLPRLSFHVHSFRSSTSLCFQKTLETMLVDLVYQGSVAGCHDLTVHQYMGLVHMERL